MRRLALLVALLALVVAADSKLRRPEVITAEKANLYVGPSTQDTYVGELETGTAVVVIEEVPDWKRVEVPGQSITGWMPAYQSKSQEQLFAKAVRTAGFECNRVISHQEKELAPLGVHHVVKCNPGGFVYDVFIPTHGSRAPVVEPRK